MKRYVLCFLFFFCLTTASLLGLLYITGEVEQENFRQVQAAEQPDHPDFAKESIHLVLNQDPIAVGKESDQFCLVAEDGYLIIYDSENIASSLFTHMPVTDFPSAEQERLIRGIWFPTMAAVFSYLESYSS